MPEETTTSTLPPVSDPTQPVESEPVQETTAAVDYTPVIADASTNICSCILFGCLCICGVLVALRLWGVRPA